MLTIEGKQQVAGIISPSAGSYSTTITITECAYPEESYKISGSLVGTGGPANTFLSHITLGVKVTGTLQQELTEIEFIEWNKGTKKAEKEKSSGNELKFGSHVDTIEGEAEFRAPEGMEMEVATE